MAPRSSTDPGEFPENHSIEVESGVEQDEGSPGENGYDTEEELECRTC